MRRTGTPAAVVVTLVSLASMASIGALVGCEVVLGYGDLKDRPADSGIVLEASGSSSGGSSGGSSGSSSGSMVDAGPACAPLASVPSSDVPPYVTVQPMVSACLMSQISAFITACTGDTASGTACMNWQNDSQNSTCQACITPNDGNGTGLSTGGVLFDAQNGFFTYNQPGCIAIVDPTHGPKCAAELEPQIQCTNVACRHCQVGTVAACFKAAVEAGGPCAAYTTPDCSADVFPDGGTIDNACSGSSDTIATQTVINAICGSGP